MKLALFCFTTRGGKHMFRELTFGTVLVEAFLGGCLIARSFDLVARLLDEDLMIHLVNFVPLANGAEATG